MTVRTWRTYADEEWARIAAAPATEAVHVPASSVPPGLDLEADAIVTDPPYGIGWRQHGGRGSGRKWGAGHRSRRDGIAGDEGTALRDAVLARWAPRPAAVFGSWRAAPPAGVVQTLVHHKPRGSGVVGATLGWRRDSEPIYLVGRWPRRPVAWSSVLHSALPSGSNRAHPHAKPVDVLEAGVVLDPFAGSGSTLVAAKLLGRRAIGIEVDERWCESAARRLRQEVLVRG